MRRKRKAAWFVFAFASPDGRIFYVGAGPALKGVHPADAMYENRFRLDSSPVIRRLREMPEPPVRVPVGNDGPMSRDAAEKLKAANLESLRGTDHKLLSPRPSDSWVTGGGRDKPIADDKGDIYLSIRAAARDLGVEPSTILRRIQRNAGNPEGWRYL